MASAFLQTGWQKTWDAVPDINYARIWGGWGIMPSRSRRREPPALTDEKATLAGTGALLSLPPLLRISRPLERAACIIRH